MMGNAFSGWQTGFSVALLLLGADVRAHAQGVSVSGIVTDTAGRPVDSADVAIGELRLRARTTADGKFQFFNVAPGEFDVRVRRVGFLPQTRRANTGSSSVSLRYSLVPTTHPLDPVVVSASRAGITGFIGDSAFNALEGATIAVISANGKATTDATGHFSIDIRPGSYLLQIEHEGFGTRMASVTVPADSGRQITVLLSAPTKNQVRERIVAFD